MLLVSRYSILTYILSFKSFVLGALKRRQIQSWPRLDPDLAPGKPQAPRARPTMPGAPITLAVPGASPWNSPYNSHDSDLF